MHSLSNLNLEQSSSWFLWCTSSIPTQEQDRRTLMSPVLILFLIQTAKELQALSQQNSLSNSWDLVLHAKTLKLLQLIMFKSVSVCFIKSSVTFNQCMNICNNTLFWGRWDSWWLINSFSSVICDFSNANNSMTHLILIYVSQQVLKCCTIILTIGYNTVYKYQHN